MIGLFASINAGQARLKQDSFRVDKLIVSWSRCYKQILQYCNFSTLNKSILIGFASHMTTVSQLEYFISELYTDAKLKFYLWPQLLVDEKTILYVNHWRHITNIAALNLNILIILQVAVGTRYISNGSLSWGNSFAWPRSSWKWSYSRKIVCELLCGIEVCRFSHDLIMLDSRMHLKVFGNTFGMISRRNLFM